MIIFLYGPDTYRSRQKLHELQDKFYREIDSTGTSITRLSGATLTIDQFNQALGAVSMFAKKRMVIVEELLSQGKKELQDEILALLQDNKLEDIILIFWEPQLGAAKSSKPKAKKKKNSDFLGFLSKQKFAQEFVELTDAQLMIWLTQEFKSHQAAIANDALKELVTLVGNDIWQLANEVDKLVAYVKGSRPDEQVVISRQDVEQLVTGQYEENIFALMDAIAQKQTKKALQLLHQALTGGEAEGYLLTMMIRQFRILLSAQSALDSGVAPTQLAKQIGQHPFVTQKAQRQIGQYGLAELKNIYQELFQIDVQLKTGAVPAKQLFDQFIISLTAQPKH